MRDRTKTVTRRSGWRFLKPGDVVNAVETCMGLRRGERMRQICQIRVTHVSREPLNRITPDDVAREGFPSWTPEQFITFYCQNMKSRPTDDVTRIAFEYIANNRNSNESIGAASPAILSS